MFLASWPATLLPLVLIGPSSLSIGVAVLASGVAALGATIIEAISPFGIDNLTIPAITGLLLVGFLL